MEVSFLGSYFRSFPPKDKPEFVFVGRSNVGKSSLINMVTGREVARVSKEPGRTRAVNYFLLEKKVYLVDVPGYGFAKVSKRERDRWRSMMDHYFRQRKDNIAKVFLLIDGVVGVQKLDRVMIRWLRYERIPFVVVLTKSDKATQSEISRVLKGVRECAGSVNVILSSAKEGRGRKDIIKILFSLEE